MKHRKAKLAAMAAVAVAAAGTADAQSITVATYGGEWGTAMQDCILTPFTEATGITVTPEPGVSAVTLSKLQQQKDAPSIDAAWMDGGVSETAQSEGLLAEIDAAQVPGIANLIPEAVYRDADGKVFAVGTGFYSLGLAYNSQDVSEPLTSWNDLWREDLAGAVTFPSPGNAMGVPFIAQIATMNGGSASQPQPGLDKLKTLDAAAYFDTAGAATNLFQSGEVIAGAHYASSVFALKDQGIPVEFVVPTDGAIGGDIRLHLVRNSANAEAAAKLVEFAIGTGPATCMANTIYVGPATKGATPDANAAERMPWGKGGTVANLLLPDWNAINESRAAVIEAFNKEVARR